MISIKVESADWSVVAYLKFKMLAEIKIGLMIVKRQMEIILVMRNYQPYY